MAETFMYGPLPPGVKECKRADGGIVRFDPAVAAFGTMSKDKRIYTYMLVLPPFDPGQTAESYFERACKK